MTFDDIEGGATIRADSEKVRKVKKHVNEEFRNEGENDLKEGRIVELCIAVGIRENRRIEPKTEGADRTSIGSLDPQGVLKRLIEIRHDDKSGRELLPIMREYYEGGATVIAEQIDGQDYFDYEKYLDE